MLIQDALTGRLHEIPDHLYGSYLGGYGQLYEPQWGEYPQGYGHSPQYGMGQVVYDGLGNPVGIFPLLAKLAPLAAKLLPAIATKVLPAITQAFPAVSSILPGAAPPPPAAMAPAPPDPQFAPPPPYQAAPPPMMAPPVPITPMQPMVQPPFGPTAAVYPPMMARMGMRVMRRRRRGGRRPIRRFAVPPPPPVMAPPEVMQPPTGVRTAEPSGAVQGWGYHGGFNGYGW
jgi:hypothetical protein